ncbi:MAG: twin-arginine translocase subunit TatC [Opitutae bacterium]|nr:twin-arginine translocase subunit TatC [Opitutae bacterium]MDG1300838.1 twin-arginine translocase subunit TatC [Opitutae bacterium]
MTDYPNSDEDDFSNGDEGEFDWDSDLQEDLEENGMSFLEHLEDFRWTVGRSILAFFLGVVIVGCLMPHVGAFLQMPLIGAYGSAELVGEKLITYKPMGVFSVFIQIALLGGLVLSMPFVLYFMACFIAPGLTDRERKVVRPACFAAFVLFLSGVAVAFYAILPLTLAFSVKFNQVMGFQVLLAASEYYNMVVWFSLATGAIFQFPLIIVILIFIQVLAVEKLKAIRRMVFVGTMIFAALLTPGGDFLSLPLTTGILYGLYELAILVGSHIEKKRRAAELAELEAEE